MKLPRLPQVEMAYLSPNELRVLLAAVSSEYRTFVELLAIGGLRFGEAAALRCGRCDVGRSRVIVAESLADVSGILHLGPPKTHQRRTVTIPRFLRDRLQERIVSMGDPDTLVFQAPNGGPIRNSNFVRRVWQRALVGAGLPSMGVHALRHTCAALLISQGAHPKAIQSHLGHRSITTTLDRYGHLFDDEHDKLADRLDAAYADLVPTGERCSETAATTLPGERGGPEGTVVVPPAKAAPDGVRSVRRSVGPLPWASADPPAADRDSDRGVARSPGNAYSV